MRSDSGPIVAEFGESSLDAVWTRPTLRPELGRTFANCGTGSANFAAERYSETIIEQRSIDTAAFQSSPLPRIHSGRTFLQSRSPERGLVCARTMWPSCASSSTSTFRNSCIFSAGGAARRAGRSGWTDAASPRGQHRHRRGARRASGTRSPPSGSSCSVATWIRGLLQSLRIWPVRRDNMRRIANWWP